MRVAPFWSKISAPLTSPNGKNFIQSFYAPSWSSLQDATDTLTKNLPLLQRSFETRLSQRTTGSLPNRTDALTGHLNSPSPLSSSKTSPLPTTLSNAPVEPLLDPYPTSDLVEPLESYASAELNPAWAMTWNSYGSRILCTRELFIADVDFETSWVFLHYRFTAPVWDRFLAAFGVKTSNYKRVESERAEFNQFIATYQNLPNLRARTELTFLWHLQRFIAPKYPDLLFSVYQTARGLRVFETTRSHATDDPKTYSLLQDLGADLAYIRLCAKQQCFRARLDPKPWRTGGTHPRFVFPLEPATPEAARFDTWAQQVRTATNTNHTAARYFFSTAKSTSGANTSTISSTSTLHQTAVCSFTQAPAALTHSINTPEALAAFALHEQYTSPTAKLA